MSCHILCNDRCSDKCPPECPKASLVETVGLYLSKRCQLMLALLSLLILQLQTRVQWSKKSEHGRYVVVQPRTEWNRNVRNS